MEQHVLDLVTQMIQRGNEVFVWCKGGVIYDWYTKAGAKVVQKDIGCDVDISYIKELRDFLVKNHIDVIHSHELKAVGNGLLAGFLARTKVRISHIHTPFSRWQVFGSKRLLYNICYAVAVRFLATKEIALADSIKKIKTQAGIPAGKIAVIPNGIDVYKFYVARNEKEIFRREVCKKYHIDPSTKIIGNLSRVTKEKGHDLLIKAFAKLIEDKKIVREDFTLLICGGGELEESLWNLAGELGVKDRLMITGRFDDDLKIKFYSAFDYFIFPTLAEGFGIVLIEALISELPVLCSDLPVLREVGEGFPKYFKTSDYLDLSQKLVDLLKDDFDDVSKVAQKNHVEKNYSLEKFGQNYQKLYESLLSV